MSLNTATIDLIVRNAGFRSVIKNVLNGVASSRGIGSPQPFAPLLLSAKNGSTFLAGLAEYWMSFEEEWANLANEVTDASASTVAGVLVRSFNYDLFCYEADFEQLALSFQGVSLILAANLRRNNRRDVTNILMPFPGSEFESFFSQYFTTVIYGTVDPTPTDGNDGDFYYNTTTEIFYGPKVAGAWPSEGIPLTPTQAVPQYIPPQDYQRHWLFDPATANYIKAIEADSLYQGVWQPGLLLTNDNYVIYRDRILQVIVDTTTDPAPEGSTVITGSADPMPIDGEDGDYYYNLRTHEFFGPKAAGLWPASGVIAAPVESEYRTIQQQQYLIPIASSTTLVNLSQTVDHQFDIETGLFGLVPGDYIEVRSASTGFWVKAPIREYNPSNGELFIVGNEQAAEYSDPRSGASDWTVRR